MTVRYAIFCADPLEPRSAKPGFEAEVLAARESGFTPVLIDHDALDHRVEPAAALRKTKIAEPGIAVYRGWMLQSEAYAALLDTLLTRGVRPITNAQAYDSCHHAPASYKFLASFMPQTLWVTADKLDDPNAIRSALEAFGDSAVIIKDWVKSQAAGYWAEACYIPRATDLHHAFSVVARFRELQAEGLVGGIVFKAYIPLIPVGTPANEYRAFIVGSRVVGCWPRSPAAAEHGGPPVELLEKVASKMPSPFASADFGIDDAGRWWLLEVGDGQVSGLPSESVAAPLFEELAALTASSG